MTVSQALEDYIKEQTALGRRVCSWKSDAREIEARWGELQVGEAVTASKVAAWIGELRTRGNAPGTIYDKLTLLKMLCVISSENGAKVVFPKRLRSAIKIDNKRSRTLTSEELSALRAVMKPRDWKLCLFAMKTGLRTQEMFLLPITDCDFRTSMMFIRYTKTGVSREVPMVGVVRKIVLESLNAGSEYAVRVYGVSGRAWSGSRIRVAENWKHQVFRPALAAAGIKDFRWHDWRHQCATSMVENGADHVAVAQMMGWESPQYLNRYANLRYGSLAEALRLS